MRLYLQRKREHDMFIAREEAEFEMGKQHLANMMGLDYQSMTQVRHYALEFTRDLEG